MTAWSVDRWLGLAGVVVGTLGLVTGWIFYVKSKREVRPVYDVQSDWVIRASTLAAAKPFGDLVLRHNDDNIKSASILRITFWNAGREPLRKEDIPSPLVISIQGGVRVLSARVGASSQPKIECTIEPGELDHELRLGFDFLDQNDGAIIEVLAEGKAREISLDGVVIGARGGFKKINALPAVPRGGRALRVLGDPLTHLAFFMAGWSILFYLAPGEAVRDAGLATFLFQFAPLGILVLVFLSVANKNLRIYRIPSTLYRKDAEPPAETKSLK